MRKLKLQIEVTPDELDRLSQCGVRLLGGREEPRRAWTEAERRQMARAYLDRVLREAVDEV